MKSESLTLVRVYLSESEHRARELLQFLKAAGIRGATLLRGVSGFGQSGKWHQADWADLVGDLPLILEFADTPEKTEAVLPQLLKQTKPRHVMRSSVEALSPD